MKKIFTIFTFFILLSTNSKANFLSIPVTKKMNEKSIATLIKNIPADQLEKMTWNDFQKVTGQKLTIQEKISFKYYKNQLKKVSVSNGEKSKTALTLSIVSLATIFIPIISIPLAIAGIVTATKALKTDEEDTKAKTAMGLSILSLGIVVVATLIYAIFISNSPFSIFIF